MHGGAVESVLFVAGVVLAGAGFIGVVFLVNSLLSPREPSPAKGEPFECGLDQAGEPWSAQRMRFSTLAMLFVLFDAEAVLLFAVATRLRGDLIAVAEVGLFVLLLGGGLAYAWRKGALEWRS